MKYLRYLFLGQFLRDLRWAGWNIKYRMWVRFAEKNLLWVHVDRKFVDERKNWKIWPSYQRF